MNAELIKALKDAEMYLNYVAPRCYASFEVGKAIRAAADALEAADKRIADLETALAACRARREQMPKRGEWINPSRNPEYVNKTFFSDCSVCGHVSMDESNYCPNCGAKMDGKDGEHE